MDFEELHKKYEQLKSKHQKIYENNHAKQYFLDESIEMMQSIKDCMLKIINAVKLHKFSIEDGKNRDDCDANLWQILDDEDISKW
jgi:hypothetical protein